MVMQLSLPSPLLSPQHFLRAVQQHHVLVMTGCYCGVQKLQNKVAKVPKLARLKVKYLEIADLIGRGTAAQNPE